MAAILCQLGLLAFHQLTTGVDLFPFNGAGNYSARERIAEMGVNAILMSLAPIGFAFHVRGLMAYGTVYYFVLFAIELIVWWVPYFTTPSGRWRRAYNLVLRLATSNFEKGDALDHWQGTHARLHSGTISPLPRRNDRIVPNLEHILLHVLTLVTAIVTACEFERPM